jgi:hypothetical protein
MTVFFQNNAVNRDGSEKILAMKIEIAVGMAVVGALQATKRKGDSGWTQILKEGEL